MQFIGLIRLLLFVLGLFVSADAQAKDHFLPGEVRVGLSWDNVSAMESGLLRFGGAAGIHLLKGFEIGYEQQFIVPPKMGYESRSWGYLRYSPFSQWLVNPFVAVRSGVYAYDHSSGVALGGGIGAVMFIDEHFAFEASLFTQGVARFGGQTEQQTDFDWRVIAYF